MSTRTATGGIRVSERRIQLAERVTAELSDLYDYLLAYSVFEAAYGKKRKVRVTKHDESSEVLSSHIHVVDYWFSEETDSEPAHAELSVHEAEKKEMHVKPARISIKIPLLDIEAELPGVAIELGSNDYAVPPPDLKSALFIAMNQHILDEIESRFEHSFGSVRITKNALSAEGNLEKIMETIMEKMEELEDELYYTPSAGFEIFPDTPPLKSVGVEEVLLHTDTIVYYRATFDYKRTFVDYKTKSPEGIELLLGAFLSEHHLRNLLRLVEKVRKSVFLALPLFLVVWGAFDTFRKPL